MCNGCFPLQSARSPVYASENQTEIWTRDWIEEIIIWKIKRRIKKHGSFGIASFHPVCCRFSTIIKKPKRMIRNLKSYCFNFYSVWFSRLFYSVYYIGYYSNKAWTKFPKTLSMLFYSSDLLWLWRNFLIGHMSL